MRQPAISPSYSKLAGSVTPTNPDDTRIECKIMDASEPESHAQSFFLNYSRLVHVSMKKSNSLQVIFPNAPASMKAKCVGSLITGIRLSLSARVQVINDWMTRAETKRIYGTRFSDPAFTQWTENFPVF